MPGRKHSEEEKEKALALLATYDSLSEVSRITGIKISTLQTWRNKHEKDTDFINLRKKKKAEFVQEAWKTIEAAQTLLARRIGRALNNEDAIDELVEEILRQDDLSQEERKAIYRKYSAIKVEDISKLTTVIGTLYDKQALANDEPTGRVDVRLEDYINKVEGDSEY